MRIEFLNKPFKAPAALEFDVPSMERRLITKMNTFSIRIDVQSLRAPLPDVDIGL